MSDAGAAPELRRLDEADLDDVLALNQRWVPHVGTLELDLLAHLVGQCSLALVARDVDGATLAGVVLALAPGADYDSANYRWFSDRYGAGSSSGSSGFRYVDRIAVAPSHQGVGVGRSLYRAVADHARDARASWVAAEVNVDPPNPDSYAFHERLGFVEVGRRGGDAGAPLVAMLEMAVEPG